MTKITETGYLKISLDATVMGAMSKGDAYDLRKGLLEFFNSYGVNVKGRISFVRIESLEVEETQNCIS